MAHGAHLLFETRLMVAFQGGNERYGGPFRYLGRRAIFPTQTLRAAGIWILSTIFSIVVGIDFSLPLWEWFYYMAIWMV